MVGQLLKALDREIRGLHEAAYVLAGFSFLSQILALVRDRTFAHLFGAGPTLDMYFAAFRVPDALFALLTLCVSSFALIPLFTSSSEEGRYGLLRSVLMLFGCVAIPLTVVTAIAVPYVMPYFTPGFAPDAVAETARIARIMLLQPLILGVSSIVSAYVQAGRRFMLFALAPIFYNLGIIVGAILLYPLCGVSGLAWGVVLGALLHLSVQLRPDDMPRVSRTTLSYREFYTRVVLPSVPRSLALFANQGLLIIFSSLATLIAAGAVSALAFAYNLQSVPLTVIGLSYASALFPALSHYVHEKNWEGYANEVWATVRHIVFWLLPATTFFIVLRAHIVRVVLGSGAFSWDDTRLTAAILAIFCVSLIGQAFLLALSRAYYAAGRTLIPIALNVGSSLAAAAAVWYAHITISNSSTILYFIEYALRVEDVPGTAVLIIPVAYTVAVLGAAGVGALLFARSYGIDRSVYTSFGASFSASVIGAACVYFALQAFGPLLPTKTFLGIFAQGALAGGIGILGWALVLRLLKNQELADVLSLLKKKFDTYGTRAHS